MDIPKGDIALFYNCNKVVVDTSILFGCGTEGLNLCETKGFSCYATEIYDCTYYIMTMSNSENVLFKNCSFHDNREFSLINSHENLNVKFSTCSFWDNYGTLISSSGDPMEFHDCEIKHPLNQLGDWLKNLNYDTIIEE